ncbi:hypothetical protein DPMN_149861 [Dreissena polymorpha]|uniref:Uncharacterized protein n=1 Tax=Dreissena polymorpha TaxID=45954 RepID=A0A9D4FI68_DREPO|nr:hypothetical protein DPMN_149861 [Dreissena polymorpha]
MNIYYWFFGKLCFFKTGKYTCIEKSTPMKLGDKAWLMSTMIKLVAKCLTFWYNMYNVQHVRRNRRQPQCLRLRARICPGIKSVTNYRKPRARLETGPCNL